MYSIVMIWKVHPSILHYYCIIGYCFLSYTSRFKHVVYNVNITFIIVKNTDFLTNTIVMCIILFCVMQSTYAYEAECVAAH
jgi:hypothetical protein